MFKSQKYQQIKINTLLKIYQAGSFYRNIPTGGRDMVRDSPNPVGA